VAVAADRCLCDSTDFLSWHAPHTRGPRPGSAHQSPAALRSPADAAAFRLSLASAHRQARQVTVCAHTSSEESGNDDEDLDANAKFRESGRSQSAAQEDGGSSSPFCWGRLAFRRDEDLGAQDRRSGDWTERRSLDCEVGCSIRGQDEEREQIWGNVSQHTLRCDGYVSEGSSVDFGNTGGGGQIMFRQGSIFEGVRVGHSKGGRDGQDGQLNDHDIEAAAERARIVAVSAVSAVEIGRVHSRWAARERLWPAFCTSMRTCDAGLS